MFTDSKQICLVLIAVSSPRCSLPALVRPLLDKGNTDLFLGVIFPICNDKNTSRRPTKPWSKGSLHMASKIVTSNCRMKDKGYQLLLKSFVAFNDMKPTKDFSFKYFLTSQNYCLNRCIRFTVTLSRTRTSLLLWPSWVLYLILSNSLDVKKKPEICKHFACCFAQEPSCPV